MIFLNDRFIKYLIVLVSTDDLVPVGTKDGSTGTGFGRPEGEGDERLAHMLTEASHMMKTPTGQTNNDDSRSNEDSSSPRTQCPSPFSKVSIL